MREPHGYIVRIYRRGYRSLAGTVEDTHTNVRRGFKTSGELLRLLRGPSGEAASPTRRTKSPSST